MRQPRLLTARMAGNAANKKGETPFQLAAACGCIELLELLAGAGADLGAADARGRRALHYASEGGQAAAAAWLIARGARGRK